MTEKLLDEFLMKIEAITLVPSSGGVYEVTIDGDLVYSKVETGEHAEYEDVAGPVRERLGQIEAATLPFLMNGGTRPAVLVGELMSGDGPFDRAADDFLADRCSRCEREIGSGGTYRNDGFYCPSCLAWQPAPY